MTLPEKIRQLRLERNMTLEEVGNIVGVGKSTVRKWENGMIKNMRRDKIKKLALALGTTPGYLIEWDDTGPSHSSESGPSFPYPTITDDVVTFPVLGDIAAGYDAIPLENWDGDTVEVPRSYLKGRQAGEYFVLCVRGDSMYPLYQSGDKVLILKQTFLDRSGQIGAVLYDSEYATLKKVEYDAQEEWIRLVPINPSYPPKEITGEDITLCRIIGIPKLLIREINN